MKDIIPKREQCRNAIQLQNWKKALKLAKGFDKVFSSDEIQKISISYECLTGRENFYKSLKHDTDSIFEEAKNILISYNEKYNNENK